MTFEEHVERALGSLPPELRQAMSNIEIVVEDEIRITVLHEVAHHFGIDEDRLAELGWS